MHKPQMTDQDIEAGVEYWHGRACRLEREAAGLRIALREVEQELAQLKTRFAELEAEQIPVVLTPPCKQRWTTP